MNARHPIDEALDNLRAYQRRADPEGVEVRVSREALNDVIRYVGSLRGALDSSLAMLDDLVQFHDRTNKPCGSYDVECPIGMGEWFEKEEREKIAAAHRILIGSP